MFGKRGGGGRRRSERVPASLLAVYSTLRTSKTAELIDICENGAQLHGECMPDTGEELFISLGRMRAFGVVAWSCEDACGVTFDTPLEADEVHEIRSRVKEARGLSADMCAARDAWNGGPIP